MRYIYLLLAVVLFSSCGNNSPKPEDILNQSMKRAEEINSAKFKLNSISINGIDTQFVSRIIYLKRNEIDTVVGLKIKIVDTDGSSIYYNGKQFMLIDDYSKKIILPDSTYSASDLIKLFTDMYSLVIKPRDGKIVDKNQNELKYEGVTNIDGRQLDIISFQSKENKPKSIIKYYFSKDDKFIRRIELKSIDKSKAFYQLMEINELNINAPTADSIFSPLIPEGYNIQFWK